MGYAIVKSDPTLVRDLKNRALLNTDNEGLAAYKVRKNNVKNTEKRMDQLESKMDMIIDLLTKGQNQ